MGGERIRNIVVFVAGTGAAGEEDLDLGVPLGKERNLGISAGEVGDLGLIGIDGAGGIALDLPSRELVTRAGVGIRTQSGRGIVVDGLVGHHIAFAAVGVEVDDVAQLPHGIENDILITGGKIDALCDLGVAEGRAVRKGDFAVGCDGPTNESGVRP